MIIGPLSLLLLITFKTFPIQFQLKDMALFFVIGSPYSLPAGILVATMISFLKDRVKWQSGNWWVKWTLVGALMGTVAGMLAFAAYLLLMACAGATITMQDRFHTPLLRMCTMAGLAAGLIVVPTALAIFSTEKMER